MYERVDDNVATERGGRAAIALEMDDGTRLARPSGPDGDGRTGIGSKRGSRSTRRRITAVAVIIATVAVGALLWVRDDASEESSVAPPTTASDDPPATTTARPTPTDAVPVAPAQPVVPAADPAPVPEPVLGAGRHPVYLTEVDVAGRTVEFDLLQFLVGADAEAYEAAHPSEYAGDDYDESPFHNDNPRLRRLPVSQEAAVLLQGESVGCGINGSQRIGFADLPGHLDSPIPGRLGLSVFWLTVENGSVIYIEEGQCAG